MVFTGYSYQLRDLVSESKIGLLDLFFAEIGATTVIQHFLKEIKVLKYQALT
jgi:hypothetical protein